jgi:hypothetical protein
VAIFFNAPVEVVSYWYGRRAAHNRPGHREATLSVSNGIERELGHVSFEANRIYDGFTIQDLESSGLTLTARERLKPNAKYCRMYLILYTLPVHADAYERSDEIMIRSRDIKSVEALSGNGYDTHGRRRCDNIILRVDCRQTGTILVVRRDRTKTRITLGDIFYVVTTDGVEQISFSLENLKRLAKLNVPLDTDFWTRL